VNCIKYVEGSGQILVATDFGLYYLNKNTTTWISYNTGLPNVIASDIEFNTVLNKLYLSTFGRGIWETSLSALKALATTGIENVSKKSEQLEIRPNPTKGQFSIDCSEHLMGADLKIIDVLGRVVYQAGLSALHSSIDVQLLPGAYYVKLERADYLAVRKIIVEN
jgi:hypothetical protein